MPGGAQWESSVVTLSSRGDVYGPAIAMREECRIRRRRRRQFLDTGIVWQPRGGAAGARMGDRIRQSLQSGECKRKYRRGAPGDDQQVSAATVNVNLNADLKANPNLVLVNPTYVFATPVFGGQFALSMAGAAGRSIAEVNGTLTATAGPLTVTRQGTIEDGRDVFSDLYPEATLRWNNGVNNWMTYMMGDIPVGTYNSANLANGGIGHGAIDSGVGYTYFNPQTGHEFSAVTGLTYNLVNPSTGYQNGIDWHLDWGASQFLTKTLLVGAVGYAYNQVSADRGCLPALCPFRIAHFRSWTTAWNHHSRRINADVS